MYYSAKGANDMYKHTPGEWSQGYDEDDDTYFVFADDGNVNEGQDIAYCFGPNRAANAFLISLAPEMLQAMMSLVKHCPHTTPEGRDAHKTARSLIQWAKKYA
jgi:hypothetical protein